MDQKAFEETRAGVLESLANRIVAAGLAKNEVDLYRAVDGLEELPQKVRARVPLKSTDMSGIGVQLEQAGSRLSAVVRRSSASIPAPAPLGEAAQVLRKVGDDLRALKT